MAMLKRIFDIQMRAMYRNVIFRGSKKVKKPSKTKLVLFALLALYVISACMFSVGFFFHMMAGVLPGWMYFSNLALMTFGAAVMMTAFSCQSLLFEAKDNELLLSLPIKPVDILGGRLLVLLTLEYLTSLLVLLPAVAVYAWVVRPAIAFYLFTIAAMLVLPLLGLTVSSLLGYLVSVLTKKLGNKSFVTLVYLAFIGIYMWGYTSLVNMATKAMESGVAPDAAWQKLLPPMYRMGMALGELDVISLAYFMLWCLVPFGVMYYILSRSFISIATANHSGRRVEYKERRLEKSSIFKALIIKEFKRFISTPIYLLNSGFGFLLSVVLGVVILVKGSGIIGNIMPELAQNATIGVLGVLCFLAAMSTTTAPSISLEGKNIWILKSNPIKTTDILGAKLMLNLVLGVPTLVFAGLCSAYAVGATTIQTAIIVLIPVGVQIFVAIMGLVFNLYFPKLDAVNETAVVKQSASVMLTLFSAFAFLAALITAYVYIKVPIEWLGAGAFVVISVINAVAYKFLMGKGVRMFEEL